MSVGFVTTYAASGSVGTSQNPTRNITVSGSNPVLVVWIAANSGTATVSSVTWSLGGGSPVEVASGRDGTSFSALWAIPAPNAGAGTVTINFSASVDWQINPLVYSSADQTTPCPGASVVTSIASGANVTMTPSGLTVGDMSTGLCSNTVTGNPVSVTTQRYVDNSTSVNMMGGDSTDTTGIAFVSDGGFDTNYYIAVRIAQFSEGGGGGTPALQESEWFTAEPQTNLSVISVW